MIYYILIYFFVNPYSFSTWWWQTLKMFWRQISLIELDWWWEYPPYNLLLNLSPFKPPFCTFVCCISPSKSIICFIVLLSTCICTFLDVLIGLLFVGSFSCWLSQLPCSSSYITYWIVWKVCGCKHGEWCYTGQKKYIYRNL